MIKGADSIIIERLKEPNSELVNKTKDFLNKFAEVGL